VMCAGVLCADAARGSGEFETELRAVKIHR